MDPIALDIRMGSTASQLQSLKTRDRLLSILVKRRGGNVLHLVQYDKSLRSYRVRSCIKLNGEIHSEMHWFEDEDLFLIAGEL